jgi:transposase
MSTHYFMALDSHCSFSELAAVTKGGRLVKRHRCVTTIPDLVEALEQVPRPRSLTFEEGPMADWLARSLQPYVDRLLVCEPRRNRLIAKDGDKDDPIDAEKLAQLFRGGYLKEVHQAGTLERSVLKQHVSFYHDRVRDRVRQGHELVALLRRHGIFLAVNTLTDPERRRAAWERMPEAPVLRRDLELLYEIYDLLCQREEETRQQLIELAQKVEPVRRFVELPGVAWIRGVTFFVYVDTPWRFGKKTALWRYCGLGLRRVHSGGGRTQTCLDARGHRRLKDVLLGAARSAIDQANNPFADKYHYWIEEEGMHPATARRNVARCLATTLWKLWTTDGQYDPARVRGVGRPTVTKTAS